MRKLTVMGLSLIVCSLTAYTQPSVVWTAGFESDAIDWYKSVRQTPDNCFVTAGISYYDLITGESRLYVGKFDDFGNEIASLQYSPEFANAGEDVQLTPDGGYVITGYTGPETNKDALLLKMDSNLDVLWAQTYGSGTSGEWEMGYHVENTNDGGFILAGQNFFESTNLSDIIIIKTDALGVVEWEQTVDYQGRDWADCVQQTQDGGYIVVGNTIYPNQLVNTILIKIDPMGNQEWLTIIGGTDDQFGHSIRETQDGGFIIGGKKTVGYYYDMLLVKTDALGAVEWEQNYGGFMDDFGWCVEITDDGGYLLCGSSLTMGDNVSDLILLKTDESGVEEWHVSGCESDFSVGYCVEQTAEGGYIACGYVLNPVNNLHDCLLMYYEDDNPQILEITLTPYNPPIHIPANGGSFDFNIELTNTDPMGFEVDIWTMATLPNGTQFGPIINVGAFPIPGSSSVNRDRTQMVPANAPAGCYTYDAYVGTFPNDIWDEDHFDFEKLAVGDGSPLYGWECWGEPFEEDATQTEVIPDEFSLFSAYPNPFNPTTNLSFSLPAAEHITLKIYDATGALVTELIDGWRNVGVHEVTFDASGLTSGVYFAQVTFDGQSHVQKLMLIK